MSGPDGVKMASINKAGSISKLKEFRILASPNGIKNSDIDIMNFKYLNFNCLS